MRVKNVLMLLELLATTGVCSVGFSSWAMLAGDSKQALVEIKGDNIIDTNEYFVTKNIDFSSCGTDGYGYYGFYTNHSYTDVLSNIAILEFDIVFSYTDFYSNFHQNTHDFPSSISISIDLGFSNSDCYNLINEAKENGIYYSSSIGFNSINSNMSDYNEIAIDYNNRPESLYSTHNIEISDEQKNSDLSIYISTKYKFDLKTYTDDEGKNIGIGSENDFKLYKDGLPLKIIATVN